jgi:hypothetical protein
MLVRSHQNKRPFLYLNVKTFFAVSRARDFFPLFSWGGHAVTWKHLCLRLRRWRREYSDIHYSSNPSIMCRLRLRRWRRGYSTINYSSNPSLCVVSDCGDGAVPVPLTRPTLAYVSQIAAMAPCLYHLLVQH